MTIPRLFSKFEQHDQYEHLKPVSAGFVKIHQANAGEYTKDGCSLRQISFECYGKSVSLGVDSQAGDSDIILRDYEFEM